MEVVYRRLRLIENLAFQNQDIQVLIKNVRNNAMVGGYGLCQEHPMLWFDQPTLWRSIATIREQGQGVLRDWVKGKLRELNQKRETEDVLREIMEESADRSEAGWIRAIE